MAGRQVYPGDARVAVGGYVGEDGTEEVQRGAYGAKNVNPVPGTGGVLHPRYLAAVGSTIETATWPAGSNITELLVFCWPNGTSPAGNNTIGMLAIDAVSDAAAAVMLTATESGAVDAGWIPIPINDAEVGSSPSFVRIPLSAALSQGSLGGGRVDVKSIDGTALNFWIAGS
jgi:hypothetical protein